jgi:hypothetical protein
MEHERHILTDGEAARILRMPRLRLLRLAKAGDVPSIRLPDGEYRFVQADLWAWVEGHKQEVAQ